MPRRFVFRMQALLEQRERDERDRQLRVAEVERERLAAEDRLRGVQREIASARDDLRRSLAGEVALGEVRLQAGATLHLELRARQCALELAGVLKRLELVRAELLRAARARKAVAILREKQFEEWKRDAARREHAELDEMMVMRHGRGSASA